VGEARQASDGAADKRSRWQINITRASSENISAGAAHWRGGKNDRWSCRAARHSKRGALNGAISAAARIFARRQWQA